MTYDQKLKQWQDICGPKWGFLELLPDFNKALADKNMIKIEEMASMIAYGNTTSKRDRFEKALKVACEKVATLVATHGKNHPEVLHATEEVAKLVTKSN